VVVVDKYWECDPVCWALTNAYLNDNCGVKLPWPKLVSYPSYGAVPTQPPTPRLIYATNNIQVEVWCVSDLLSKFPNTPVYQSSSQRKMEVMGQIFSYSPSRVDLVVSACTASSGPFCPPFNDQPQSNVNGSVIVGTEVFIHDGHPAGNPNPDSQWRCPYFDQLMKSAFSVNELMKKVRLQSLETALLCPPNNPATSGQHIYGDASYAALGLINVTNYTEYTVKDKETGNSFLSKCPGNTGGVSLETTHGLVYAAARAFFKDTDPPFFFVSGITDRYTMFDQDVQPKVYAQNVSCAHNAGVMVAQLVSDLA
jgi:hypothetical protein